MSVVYFIQAGAGGPIKIGFTRNIIGRVSALRWQVRRPVNLLASIPGGQCEERRFHLQFLNDWLGGEWFAPSAALLSAIEAVKAGTFEMGSLPPKKSLPRSILWRSLSLESLAA